MSDKQPLPTGLQLTALDPVFRERPHEYLDRLRIEDPVHRDAELGRLFLTRFDDVRAVVSNRALSVDPRKAQPDSYFRRILATNEPLSRRCSILMILTISASGDLYPRLLTSERWTPFGRAFAPLLTSCLTR